MLRLIHTSDWHLGHVLHDRDRVEEHAAFLDWLLDQLEAVDALIVAGDVYDTANPGAAAMRQLYRFVARARARHPKLDIVIVAGNHDAPARIDAPEPILSGLGVRVVGDPRGEDGQLDLSRLLVPLHDAGGAVAAWVAAVPFLRPCDLPPVPELEGKSATAEGVRRVYEQIVAEARTRRRAGQALLATGHATVSGGRVTDSERPIGHIDALSADLFPTDLAYVALGHLHAAQAVAGRHHLRYSGSPIPLSFDEQTYEHQVLLIELDGERLVSVDPLRVPRTVEVLRLPVEGPAPLESVLPLLQALPDRGDLPDWRRPFLEVRVGPIDRGTRRAIEDALEGKAARLARIPPWRPEARSEPFPDLTATALSDLAPEEVFMRAWKSTRQEEIPTAVLEVFRELLASVEHEGGVA